MAVTDTDTQDGCEWLSWWASVPVSGYHWLAMAVRTTDSQDGCQWLWLADYDDGCEGT